MKKTISILSLLIVIGFLTTGGLFSKKENKGAPPEQAASGSAIAAKVGNQSITMADLEAAAKNDLAPLATQIYQIKKRRLDQMVEEALYEQEAKSQNKSAADIRKNLDSPADGEVSDDAIEVYYDLNQQRFQGRPLADVKEEIRRSLIQTKSAKKKADFMTDLRKKYAVQFFLEEPKVEVNVGNAPFRGPADAKVTIVEFSDFECPFCSRFKDTMDQLYKEYPNDVKQVYRHNPLPFHKNARPSAKASICAHRQGKFWEMRSQLFANQKALDDASNRKYAEAIGLNMGDYDACIKEPGLDKQIDDDVQYAQSVGARGTPTSFINGVLFSGAQPYPALKKVVDEKFANS